MASSKKSEPSKKKPYEEFIRKENAVPSDIKSDTSVALPDFVVEKWKKMLNMLSKVTSVKVSLITQHNINFLEVMAANSNVLHPFKQGDKDRQPYKLYCEAVMSLREPIMVENAKSDPRWKENPDLTEHNLVAYYGEPVLWPDNEMFGTICFMNDQTTHFSDTDIDLLSTCRESVEKDLKVYSQYTELHTVKSKLQRLNEQLEEKVNTSTQKLEKSYGQLKKKNQELQKVNHELDRFIYSASHGLKAPLTTMQGLIHLCKVENEKEKLADIYLKLMENSVVNLQNIIQSLSNYSLNARASLKLTPVNLHSLLSEIVDSLRFMPQMGHIQIDLEVDKNVMILSDEGRLKIIFYNLLSNAIKFYDPEKADSFVHIRLVKQSPQVVMEVEDNGLGIPTESQNKIFQLFYRATAVSEGPGMGLFIVKESLEMLGGSITVTSELGKGATFKVTLPGEKKDAQETED